ncbi:MAG: hypothetical protein JJ850_08320, partial [Kordiimonadaceae bacterium]|nr:hypothetical protein [Kordiimonadaceae bacterium]
MSTDDTQARTNLVHLPYADAIHGVRHVFVRDYETDAEIGVWSHEKGDTQKVRISVDLSVLE